MTAPSKNCAPPLNELTLSNYAAATNPCALLPALRMCLYQLMAGQRVAETRLGDQWLRFAPGQVPELRKEVRRLEYLCTPGNPGRAVQVGPLRRSSCFPGYYT